MIAGFATEIAATAKDVFERQLPRDQLVKRLRREGFSRRTWASAAELGWFRLLTSAPCGGLDAGPAELAALFREVGRYLPAGPFLEAVVAGGLFRSHVDLGPDDRVTTFGRLGEGVALVEFADVADRILLWTGKEVLSLDGAAARIDAVPSFDLASRPCRVEPSGAATVVLDGQAARELAARIDVLEAIAGIATLAGLTAELLEMSVQHAKDRVQFDRPIGSFQAVQHRLAEDAVTAAAIESTLSAALEMAPAAVPDALAIAALRAQSADLARRVAESSLQVHGGIGFTDDHRLHVYLKHVLRLQAVAHPDPDPLVELGARLLAAR
jgi:alkylation response protein AidB-like acyl-CoA dehydrogenase